MPKYVYQCCDGHVVEDIRPIAERDNATVCTVGSCEHELKRVEIPAATPYVTRPGVGDRSPFSRDRAGK